MEIIERIYYKENQIIDFILYFLILFNYYEYAND